MCELYKNKGGMWNVKKELFDLVFNDLDHALGSMEDIARQTQIRSELRGILTSEEELIGVFPVGGDWGQNTAVDIRFRPSLIAMRLSDLVRLRVDFISFHRSTAGGQYWPYSPNDDDDVPNGLAAISKVPAAGWGQILAYMAFCEVSQDQSPGTPAAAGDFGFKVLTSSDPAEKTKKLSAELANGRLAMP
eukprot:s3364_g1.t1